MASSSSRPAKESPHIITKKKERPHIIVAATGCVASVKLGAICYGLLEWADVQIVVTEHAKPFIDTTRLPSNLTVYSDANEFTTWKKSEDPVLHIELEEWADMMLIAPLSSNTLAKIAGGICDNLLTSIVKIWNFEKKPLLIAPAMNTRMWKNCLTEKHLKFLKEEMRVVHIRPRFSGNSEPGPMAEISEIFYATQDAWDDLNP